MSLAKPRTLLEHLIAGQPYTWQEFEARFDERARACGERVSLSWRHLQRIAAGEIGRPRPAVARVLTDMFAHTIEELLAPPPSPASDDTPEVAETMRRRELLASAIAASVGAAAPESVARVMDGLMFGQPRRVGMSDVVAIESAIETYLHFDLARSGELASSFARSLLGWSTGLLEAEMSGQTRQRLSSAVALLADRLGWSIYDSPVSGGAGRMLTFALDHAARGADPDLRAHVMLDLSSTLVDAGSPAAGVDLLRAALGDERISAAERANLHAVCARHCAAAGQRNAGFRHVQLAEDALAARDPERGPDWAQQITRGRGHHDSALGLALFARGDDVGARQRLQAAVGRLDRGRTRTGLRCRIRLAVLDLREGERITAEVEGRRVVADAVGVTSSRVHRDLRMLGAHAAEHGAADLAALITPG